MGVYAMAASQCYRLCRTGRTHGMKSEECYNVSLRTIPECLSRDVEVNKFISSADKFRNSTTADKQISRLLNFLNKGIDGVDV